MLTQGPGNIEYELMPCDKRMHAIERLHCLSDMLWHGNDFLTSGHQTRQEGVGYLDVLQVLEQLLRLFVLSTHLQN